MDRGRSIRRIGQACMLALMVLVLLAQSGLAAGIRVVPSVERVLPGEDFYLDIVAEGIPVDDGLGTVQFRLNVAAPGARVSGVPDLNQGGADSVAIATPLLISEPTATRSGLGPFFQGLYQGSEGILVLDNEPLANGSALFTYAHTNGANRPAGTGVVARFRVRVGAAVVAEKIDFTLTDVLLLDGGPAYPLDSNVGATVTLRCTASVPDLAGKSLTEAQSVLAAAGLTTGRIYEINNPGSAQPLGVVLGHSAPVGSELDCEAAVDLAINVAPAEVTALVAADVASDDTGKVALSWTPSLSPDTAGYRCYAGATLLADIPSALATGTVIAGLENGLSQTLRVAAYDGFGNQSPGVTVTVTPHDDLPPLVTISGVTAGTYYSAAVTPQVEIVETNLAIRTITLNGDPYDLSPVLQDGNYVLIASATDVSGNTTSRSVAFTIDATPPVITVANLIDGGHYAAARIPEIAVVDANVEVFATTYLLDGQSYLPGIVVAGEGPHTLEISARDKAGNEATQTLHFVIDKTAPVITIAGIVDGKHFNIDVAPTVSISDTYLKSSSVSLNGQLFASGAPVSAEGEYVLTVSGEDAAGNRSVQTVRFVIDKTPPVIAVSGVANGVLYNVDVVPAVTINDLYLLSNNLTINNLPFVSSTAVSAEGSYSLSATAEDRAGNRAAVALDFVIDKTSPTTTSTVGVPRYTHGEQLFIAAETAITLSSVDAGVVPTGVDVIEFTLDQAEPWSPYGGVFVLAEKREGRHDLYYRAADKAGNLESVQTLPVILDKSAPATSISPSGAQFTDAGGALFVAATTEFSLASTDNLSGVMSTTYRIDGGAWTAYAPFTLAGLADGAHMIGYRSIDNVNNVEGEHALNVMIDNTPPVTTLRTSDPKYMGEALYVTATSEFTLAATDNLSGVASTEYRIDGGTWKVYAPFNLINLVDGEHTIGFRSVDNGSNVETEQLLTVVIDNTAPVTTINIGDPKYRGEVLYVTGATEFTLTVTDNHSGVAKTEYHIDGGSGVAYAPFTLSGLPDGEHLIEFSSVDKILNVEEEQAVAVVVDNTPPATSIVLNHQSYFAGEGLMVSRETEITLNAFDQLSGVAITQYRFDDSAGWSSYDGSFRLTDLAYGVHSLHYRSVDNVNNWEVEKSVIITLVGLEVETEILNRPRVLVWSEDPAKQGGNNRPSWGIEEVRELVDEALGVPDIYTTMTADKDEFRSLLRSGIYNMVMILNQDIPLDTIFQREMREAVNRGMGLLVSSWGNSVPPLWQEVFGVDFKGSLSMNEEERVLSLFDSPVSDVQSLTAQGRVLRTVLDGGTLAGILPAESTCEGLRSLSLRYPHAMTVGDRVTVSLSVPQGKKSVVVDEEVLTISALPQGAVNRFTGNIAGDIAIGGIAAEGITLSLSSPYGYLEASYSLSVKILRTDGSIITVGPVAITSVCTANLSADINLGPFKIVAVEEDRVKTGNDLPAVVLGEYGEGRTVFLSYNIIESALKGQRSEHLGLLQRSATWLLPEAAVPEAGGVTLIESRVRLLGADLDLQTVDTLGEGLSHQPLFELTHTPLSYTFHLADGEQAVYRYFVRIADHQGDYDKSTSVLLGLDDGFVPFADYPSGFSVGDDSYTLLLKALAWIDGQLPAHPEAADALLSLRDELVRIDTLPRTTPAEEETLIHQTVQTLHQVAQLAFDSVELRTLLDQYLRIVEGEGYFDR